MAEYNTFKNTPNLDNVKVGDTVTRMLAGVIPLKCIIGNIDDQFIYVGSSDGVIPWEEGWKFDKVTGAEVDEELGWVAGRPTGSFIYFEDGSE